MARDSSHIFLLQFCVSCALSCALFLKNGEFHVPQSEHSVPFEHQKTLYFQRLQPFSLKVQGS